MQPKQWQLVGFTVWPRKDIVKQMGAYQAGTHSQQANQLRLDIPTHTEPFYCGHHLAKKMCPGVLG